MPSFFGSLFNGLGSLFSGAAAPGLGDIFAQSIPFVTQALGGGRSSSRSPLEQITSNFLRQSVRSGGIIPGNASSGSASFGGSNASRSSGQFHSTNGQALAQLAAALNRASRRYL